jgi:poly(A) polymerase
MKETGVLAEVLPEVKSSTRLYHLVSADQASGYGSDAELRLAALLPPGMAATEDAARRLKLSNAARARLIKAAADGPHIHPGMGPKAVRQTVWRIGVQAFCDRARLVWADQAAAGEGAPADAWQALIAMAQRWIRPTLPVGGEDAVAAGAARGPQVGQGLADLEAWWIDQDFPADRGMVLAELKAIVGKGAK